jgi:solute carrier family 8 (sodium/calcium exchanger)
MEHEGLKRSLEFLVNIKKLVVSVMVTDRHTQIKKYLRTKWGGIKHWFDCWHVAKG